jgi:hypothetical protein
MDNLQGLAGVLSIDRHPAGGFVVRRADKIGVCGVYVWRKIAVLKGETASKGAFYDESQTAILVRQQLSPEESPPLHRNFKKSNLPIAVTRPRGWENK